MPPRPWAPQGESRTLPLEQALREREPNEKAVQAVHQALSNPDAETEVVAECVEKLSEWIRRQALPAQRMILQSRLGPVLVQIMKNHAGNVEVARHCCRVVAAVSNRHAENTNSFVKSGVVAALNDIMDLHLEDAQVQENGMQCLICLAEKSAAREIIATGGIGRCLLTLNKHPDNTFIQRNGWRCLELLVANGIELTDSMRKEIIDVADVVTRTTGAIMSSQHPKDKTTQKIAERLAQWVQNCVMEQRRIPRMTPSVRTSSPIEVEEVKPTHGEEMDLRAWLLSLDQTGGLVMYHSVLAENFDSVTHLVDAYTNNGELDVQFFEDIAVTKIGHRRKFEQWFAQHLSECSTH